MGGKAREKVGTQTPFATMATDMSMYIGVRVPVKGYRVKAVKQVKLRGWGPQLSTCPAPYHKLRAS